MGERSGGGAGNVTDNGGDSSAVGSGNRVGRAFDRAGGRVCNLRKIARIEAGSAFCGGIV